MNELEFVIDKIIEIDNKSDEMRSDTKKQIADKELDLSIKIKALSDEGLGSLKMELEKKHAQSIKNAEDTAKIMLKETDDLCTIIKKNYNSIKDDLKEKIVADIIELS